MPTGIYIRRFPPPALGKHWKLSDETKKKMRKPKSEETKKKMRKPKSDIARLNLIGRKPTKGMLGKHHSRETRIKMGAKHKGENCHFWRGGVCSENELARKSIEYSLWREAVFARDNWTCCKCHKKGGYLHPHHIKSWSKFPELRFAIDNGQTLCRECHKLTDNFGYKNNKIKNLKMENI